MMDYKMLLYDFYYCVLTTYLCKSHIISKHEQNSLVISIVPVRSKMTTPI